MHHFFNRSNHTKLPRYDSPTTTTTDTTTVMTTTTAATITSRHRKVIRSTVTFIGLIPILSYWNVWSAHNKIRQNMTISDSYPFHLLAPTTVSMYETPVPSLQQQQQPADTSTTKRRRQSSSLTTTPMNRTITIVLHLKGELGNHLSVIAGAYVTKYKLQQRYPYIAIEFIGQHQDNPKWTRPVNDIRKCFPKIYESLSIFDGGIHDPIHYHSVSQQQKSWLSQRQLHLLKNVYDNTAMDLLHRLLSSQRNGKAPQLKPYDDDDRRINATVVDRTNVGKYQYSLPYLIADKFYWRELLSDLELYNYIRQIFVMNETACCSIGSNDDDSDKSTINSTSSSSTNVQLVQPQANDIVFHHRNFLYEVRKELILKFGTLFLEVTPYTASHYLFINHTASPPTMDDENNDNRLVLNTNATSQKKRRIAILGRSVEGFEKYQQAFNETNHLSSYIVHNTPSSSSSTSKTDRASSGVLDFCFITKSRRDNEVIGKLHSTFVQWSALLSNASIVRFYTINDARKELFRNEDNGEETDSTSSLLPPPPPRMKVINHYVLDDRHFIVEEYWQPPTVP